MNKIDFVVTWVDSTDKKWLKEKEKYSPEKNTDNSSIRYRNWDTLKYWFRGVEKFAPWVNKIYFVTYGHVPKWLNLDNPKLVVVKHSDYMDKKYLPTFNSIPIELNMHKIKGLSENFVYFNDDMFLISDTKPTDFFKNDLPCDTALLKLNTPIDEDGFNNTIFNDTYIINKYFDMRKVIKNNIFKWYNIKYGKKVFRSILLSTWWNFPGFLVCHLPVSYKKSTFEEVWNLEGKYLDEVCSQKFRNNYTSVNHFIMQYWQLATNKFIPRTIKFGKLFDLKDDTQEIVNIIRNQKYKSICINDNNKIKNIIKIKQDINEAFETILPNKSNFEK